MVLIAVLPVSAVLEEEGVASKSGSSFRADRSTWCTRGEEEECRGNSSDRISVTKVVAETLLQLYLILIGQEMFYNLVCTISLCFAYLYSILLNLLDFKQAIFPYCVVVRVFFFISKTLIKYSKLKSNMINDHAFSK